MSFTPDKNKVTVGYRKMHNEELYYLNLSRKYYCKNKIREDVIDMAYSTHELRVHTHFLSRNPKESEGRARHKLEDNIKMNLREIRWKVWNRFM
jgi:hypothetical protein